MAGNIMLLFFNGLLAFMSAFLLSFYLCRSTLPLEILDHPNTRSLHQHPIPRTGGLALLGGILVGMVFNRVATANPPVPLMGGLLSSLALLAIISFQDDRGGVSTKWRILVHLLVAVSLLFIGLVCHQIELPGLIFPLAGWIGVPLTILFIVWMINLYNFMDGMDGFAGGMAVIGFATLAWLGRADSQYTAFCLIIVAASAGFLVHNFPPAKLFMGDTGSTTLGLLVAACSLWGSKAGLFPLWVALLVFSPFIADATVTLLRRLLRGERIWEAHRTHYYQRLVLLGWGHRRTVLVEYVLMLACAGSAAWAVSLSPSGQTILAATWIFIYVLLMIGVGWLKRRRATVSAL
ncbi:MAG: glycosyltransferase family 4 protein [Candidatus Competibacteraceae bacterium]|nr:glycosyltransferase family 4 protein [Candidatus Competibacteraceae bacterium]